MTVNQMGDVWWSTYADDLTTQSERMSLTDFSLSRTQTQEHYKGGGAQSMDRPVSINEFISSLKKFMLIYRGPLSPLSLSRNS